MTPPATPNLCQRHRFPGEIMSHAVWLYYRFRLSHRDVEELLFERGIIISYEAIRKGCRKFGQGYANKLRRRRPRRHLLRAGAYRQEMAHRFAIWQDMTGTATA